MLNAAFLPLSLWLLNVDVAALLLVSAHTQVHTVVLHCGYEPFPRWWLERRRTRWVATPLFHDSTIRGCAATSASTLPSGTARS